jgi:ABC-type transport system involved in multi-copper enzyme maturation permease subunit
MRIIAVAHNTFRESVRDKALYVLLFFAATTILGSKAIGWISIGQDIKVMKDICLAAVLLFGVLIAIFVGTTLVHKEIDKRTLYTILARPMRRYEFILGKYLGLASLLALVTVVMTASAALYISALGGAIGLVFIEAAVLIYCELLLITAFAILLSTLTSPILGALVLFSIFVLGNGTRILADLPQQFDNVPGTWALQSLYYVLPNLGNFNLLREAANGVPVSGAYVAWAVVYGAIYSAMLLAVAAAAFERKDV